MRGKSERDTHIICTLGPASSSEEMLKKMADRGANVVRLNFSHATHQKHEERIDLVRFVNKKYNFNLKILGDLAGYRIRLGDFKDDIEVRKGEIVYFSSKRDVVKDHKRRYIIWDYEDDLANIPINAEVFVDDGRLALKVIEIEEDQIKVKVVVGGVLKSRKGVNIPKMNLISNIMTKQDEKDLKFMIKNKIDFVAQSFVRNKEDIERIMERVKPVLPRTRVIAKIESLEGVKNVDSILEACDGVMVARGDLGVTMPLYKIPVTQKYLIRRCMRKKKIAITATQMLESMIDEGRPTRAEVSDVANAILDGTNYVMLSGETAVGRFPSRCVQTMVQIINYTERYLDPEI